MNPLKYVAAVAALSSAILAQQPPNTQTKPPKPADPGASVRSQADRTSPATSGSDSRTWTGTIVNATCSQAIDLPSSSSRAGGTPSTAPNDDAKGSSGSSSSKSKNEKSVYDFQREVIKHCPADSNAGSFAVLTDDGSFYKLDDAGNNQVKSLSSSSDKPKKKMKNVRVTVTGTVQGDTLKVQSLTKTDKPFSA